MSIRFICAALKKERVAAGMGLLVLVIAAGLVLVPYLFHTLQRHLHGVPTGVTLEGHSVSGLLKAELYDAVASLAEAVQTEAINARWDWQENNIIQEQAGQVVDISETVDRVLQSPAGINVSLITIDVLPSITSAHFQPYRKGDPEKTALSLMINVDWGNEYIPAMLKVLAEHQAEATWFLTGRWASAFPALAHQIAEAGHELGNHGGHHAMASEMNSDEVRELILAGERAITNTTGQKPTLFAPPAGDFNQHTVAAAAELGYRTILWSIDTVDWRRPPATVIIDRVVPQAQNGSLILMHPTQPTLEALPLIIQELQRKGFRLVTVSELLGSY